MRANLYVREITNSCNVYSALEITVTKSPVLYRYTESKPKTFFTLTGVQSWSHEDVFIREPFQRFAIAMATNETFLGAKWVSGFPFQNFNLNSIKVYRNGYPLAGTSLQTGMIRNYILTCLKL